MIKKINRVHSLWKKQCAGLAARYYNARYRSAESKGDKVASSYYRLKMDADQRIVDEIDARRDIDRTMSRLGITNNQRRRICLVFVSGR